MILKFRKMKKKSQRESKMKFQKKAGIMSGIIDDLNESWVRTKCLGQVSEKWEV